MTTKIYSIDGNIGSGKSTLIQMMKNILKDDPRYHFLEEPVNIWETIKDASGETILSKFYADQARYAFPFQMMAYISRISMLKQGIKEHPGKVIICERSVLTDRNVFAQMLHDVGHIEDIELQIYQKWFDEFIEDISVTGVIYVRAAPETSHARVLKRARPGEAIPLEYLKQCHEYHEKWLATSDNKLVLEADDHKEMREEDYIAWLEQINRFISDRGSYTTSTVH
jgi:deoxyadenosine/deoxycytidine kinase